MNTTLNNKTYRFETHVIDNNTDNLLSKDTAYKMGLVILGANVNECMKRRPCKNMLRENVVPYCISTARYIPFPVLPKLK